MTASSTLVRSTRAQQRLSQTTLAARSGVSQPALSQIESGEREPNWSTLDRILRSTGVGLIAIPTRRADAASVALQLGDALQADDPAAAVRHFIQLSDDLSAEHDDVRFALTISEPPPTGSKRWDAALAGLVEHWLTAESLPLPAWVRDPRRRLGKTWTFGSGRFQVPVPRGRVPRAFLERGILIDSDTLASV